MNQENTDNMNLSENQQIQQGSYQDPLQGNYQSTYQDPIGNQNTITPVKKKIGGSTIAATIISIVLIRLFGLIGGLICYGGYWAIYAVAKKTKLPLAAKIIISILLGIVFLVLLFMFIIFSAVIQANLGR